MNTEAGKVTVWNYNQKTCVVMMAYELPSPLNAFSEAVIQIISCVAQVSRHI